jgi:hypothetical protein
MTATLFVGHVSIIAALESGGMATFEVWEKTTLYAVSFSETGISLGEDLNSAWEVESPVDEEIIEEEPTEEEIQA